MPLIHSLGQRQQRAAYWLLNGRVIHLLTADEYDSVHRAGTPGGRRLFMGQTRLAPSEAVNFPTMKL